MSWNSTIEKIYNRYGETLISKGFIRLDCGAYRMVYQRKGIVIKVPINEDGIFDNMIEDAAWHIHKSKPTRDGYYLAPCRILRNKCLMMVTVDVESNGELPDWASDIDGCQVGIYKNEFVAYDYAINVEVPRYLVQKYIGYF